MLLPLVAISFTSNSQLTYLLLQQQPVPLAIPQAAQHVLSLSEMLLCQFEAFHITGYNLNQNSEDVYSLLSKLN